MDNKIVLRLYNNLGNKMFMYASAFSIAKQLRRELLIDDETAFNLNQNLHKFNLNIFDYSAKKAPDSLKFKGFKGYIKRKVMKNLDIFINRKNFYIEQKDKNKITYFNKNYINIDFKDNLFLEGHFESEKYFIDYKKEIVNEFNFKRQYNLEKNQIFSLLKDSTSVCVCLRQNRFSEKKRSITNQDMQESDKFSIEQSIYIKKAMDILKSKLSNPKFFLWSNDYKNVFKYLPKNEFTLISTNEIDLDLFLMTQAKHYIVIPSSFNWWGCWLSENKEKIVFRPSNNIFTHYKINNIDFWPENWLEINLNE